jgi:hypothetical protein
MPPTIAPNLPLPKEAPYNPRLHGVKGRIITTNPGPSKPLPGMGYKFGIPELPQVSPIIISGVLPLPDPAEMLKNLLNGKNPNPLAGTHIVDGGFDPSNKSDPTSQKGAVEKGEWAQQIIYWGGIVVVGGLLFAVGASLLGQPDYAGLAQSVVKTTRGGK